jgi:hypothetical protein
LAGFHSAMSPSKIEQYSICAASFRASQGAPNLSKLDAVTGSAAHEIHERCLNTGAKAAQFFGEVVTVHEPERPWHITVDDEMVYFVQESVDRCNELPGLVFVEVRVDISPYTPLPDFSIDAANRTLYVVDFKYGKGVRVHALRRPQLVYYALGVLHEYGCLFDIEHVVIRVHQPRLDHWDEWVTTPAELRELGLHHKARLQRCLEPDPPFHPDEKACKFCAIKSECKARAEHVRRMVTAMFDDLDAEITELGDEWPQSAPDAQRMSVQDLVNVYRHAALVRDFLNAVEVRLLHLLLHSEDVPGLKVVEGRSRRRYRDPVAARQAASYLMQHGVSPSKVFAVDTVSPAKAERLLSKDSRKEFVETYVIKPPGKPTIAPSDDGRPIYHLTAAQQFDDLDADDEDEE